MSWWRSHSRVVVFHTPHRGQRVTRICPYLVSFSTFYYSLPLSQNRSLTLFPLSVSPPILIRVCRCRLRRPLPGPFQVYLCLIPPLHLHLLPGVLSVYSHRSRIDYVAMNYATVFCLLWMYYSIASNPASFLDDAAEVYSYFPSIRLRGSLPFSRRATWYWNPPRIRPMPGVTTQVSVPKISTNWTTVFNKKPDIRGAAPFLLRILVNLRHTSRALSKFLTTSGQSLSAAEITRPNYLK